MSYVCSEHATIVACGERPIWMHLYMRYRDSVQPRKHWPDRPLHLYDNNELQELVTTPFRVDRAWKTDNLKPSSERSFSVRNAEASVPGQLIRGGRWFLLGANHGVILYFDLNAAEIRGRTLVPSPYGPSASDVLDWTQAERSARTRKVITRIFSYIYLLPNHWIIGSTGYNVFLFNLHDVADQSTQALRDDDAVTPHRAQFHVRSTGLWKPYGA